jgi:hypothetical protein
MDSRGNSPRRGLRKEGRWGLVTNASQEAVDGSKDALVCDCSSFSLPASFDLLCFPCMFFLSSFFFFDFPVLHRSRAPSSLPSTSAFPPPLHAPLTLRSQKQNKTQTLLTAFAEAGHQIRPQDLGVDMLAEDAVLAEAIACIARHGSVAGHPTGLGALKPRPATVLRRACIHIAKALRLHAGQRRRSIRRHAPCAKQQQQQLQHQHRRRHR